MFSISPLVKLIELCSNVKLGLKHKRLQSIFLCHFESNLVFLLCFNDRVLIITMQAIFGGAGMALNA